MSLRTPNPLNNSQTLMDLQRSKERMAVLSEQMSSNSRIVRLSDDPTGSALIVDFQNSISKNEQYVKQGDRAGEFLHVTETTLSSMNEALTRLQELTTGALVGNTTASGRAAIAVEVDGIRSNLFALSNTQFEGKYIFGGTKTNTPPFTGFPAGPILFGGDGNSIDLNVSASTSISTNLTGDQVFFGGAGGQGTAADLFQQVADLRDQLNANNTAGIQTATNNLQTIFARVNNQITDVGGRQATLNQMSADLQAYNTSLETIQSTYQSVDLPTAMANYTMEQISQQAALSMIAKASKTNLFDYLG